MSNAVPILTLWNSALRVDTVAMKRRVVFSVLLILWSVVSLPGCLVGKGSGSTSGSGGIDPGVYQRGTASWYGEEFHGRPTASGEPFDMNALTAAHKTLPFGTMIDVTNSENARRITVKINDRGPFVEGRIIDLSKRAAIELGMVTSGTAQVELRIVDPS